MGFSLHAGVASKTRNRKKLERLCRYIARPADSVERLALTLQGNVQYELKKPILKWDHARALKSRKAMKKGPGLRIQPFSFPIDRKTARRCVENKDYIAGCFGMNGNCIWSRP